jgi:general secretion pathway protein C
VSFDSLLKKYFVAVVCALIALAAYFQAAGLSQLVGSALTLSPTDAPKPTAGAAAAARIERPRATAIIDRNPFDSVTGPLNAQPIEEPTKQAIDVSDPLAVPRCEGVNVHIITESDDPLWSFAAVQGPGEQSPVLRRVGDAIGDKKVAYIGFNPVEASPAIWLEGTSLCQALLFATAQPIAPPAATPAAPGGEAPPADTGKRDSRSIDPELKSKIRKLSDTEFEIDRSAVDTILERQGDLMKSARIVPEQKDGKVVGIRLFGVRPDTLLGTLGLQNGDRLEQINGFDMGSPEKALEAYARLRTAPNLTVKINRRGQSMNLTMNIK